MAPHTQAAGEGGGRSYLRLLAGAVGPLGALAARQAAAAVGSGDEAVRAGVGSGLGQMGY